MGFELLIPMVVVLVAMMGMTALAGRKEKKKRAAMFDALKRNDRVMTSSGIIGTIIEIGPQEVVLRVEDGRIRFSRTAVQTVIEAAAGTASEEKTKEPALSR
jgi:preprotein translocase subunit YajC